MPAHFQSRIILGGIAILLLAGAAYTLLGLSPSSGSKSPDTVTHADGCSAEAMQCPDGSYVGRTGPNCEFAACPVIKPKGSGTTADPYTANVSANFNQTVTVGDVSITPVSLIEDSRCPTGVQCVQAGTVRITASVKDSGGVSVLKLGLGTSASTGSDTITLIGVYPAKKTGVTLKPSDYQLTFHVTSQ